MKKLTCWFAAAALLAALAPAFADARPSLGWEAPPGGVPGSAAGELRFPGGVAFDGSTGDVYVADTNNARVSVFSVWGEFERAWGWGVVDGEPEAQVCTSLTGCQGGIEGAGSGQVARPQGIAVDSSGNVYVHEVAIEDRFFGEKNYRVQKFDSEGNFLLMFGGEVNKTSGANVCTALDVEGGDVCGSGVPGTGDGEFADTSVERGDRIAVDPVGNVFVGDVNRIQKFSPEGAYLASIPLPGETVRALDLDAVGNIYVVFADSGNPAISKDGIRKLNPAGGQTALFAVEDPRGVALDAAGNVYGIEEPQLPGYEGRIVMFNAAGTQLIPTAEEETEFAAAHLNGEHYEFFEEANTTSFGQLFGLTISNACGIGSDGLLGGALYVTRFASGESAIRAYGDGPDPSICPSNTPGPPIITDQFASRVGSDSATVKARINPRFETDTTYYVEYGTGKCSEGGCTKTAPVPPYLLSEEPVGIPTLTKGVLLAELQPGTTYHYRFVSESSAGGPVYGIDPDGSGPEEASFEEGLEATFTTTLLPGVGGIPCPNEQFRLGPSAALPDCRAYEMVSPVDKNNGDIIALFNSIGDPAGLNQSAVSGEVMTYSSYRSFGDAKSAPYTTQYMATRLATGWGTHSISPPRGVLSNVDNGGLDSEYRAFTEDLCRGWLLHDTDPILAPGAIEGFTNLYRWNDVSGRCANPPGEFDALSTVSPPEHQGSDSISYEPVLQGTSADGSLAAFRVDDRLTDNAAPGDNFQCYEAIGNGDLRLLSLLPDGSANPTNCSVGTENGGLRQGGLESAVSEDGSHIFWTASGGTAGQGQLYLRKEGKNPTIAVSVGANARFLTAAADGSKAIYSEGSLETGADLYVFNTATQTSAPIAEEVRGILGASSDASRVYLVSEEGEDGGVAGEPNLYLHEEEGSDLVFIGKLSEADADPFTTGKMPSTVNVEPGLRVSRVTPDGLHATFMSTGSPTGFDNTDLNSGEPDAEVYRYDAAADQLRCVSCNPSGVRPAGRKIGGAGAGYWAAAQISAWASQLYAPRVISENGSRVFFESFEALVPRDTNGKQDVYEWEESGTGTCTEGSSSYRELNGGCVYLISTGDFSADAEFLDSSPIGNDVFFTTGASLVPQDPALIDVYDARVGGGFTPPPLPPQPCSGEACQAPGVQPQAPTPASSTYTGQGNLKPQKPRRCPKGKHKIKRGGKVRCVKNGKKKRAAKRTASRNKGAGR